MSKRLIMVVLAILLLVGLTLPVSAADADTLTDKGKYLTPEQIAELLKDLPPRPPLPEYPGGGAKDSDITPPYLEITSIDIGTDYASFEWYAEDETTDPEYLYYYWGLAYYCGGYGYDVTGANFYSLPPGNYTFYVVVEDWSFNQSGEYYPFEIEEPPPPPDTTPPSLSIISANIGPDYAEFYWYAEDETTALEDIYYYWGIYDVYNNSYYDVTDFYFGHLAAGDYKFYVIAEDESDNQSMEECEFHVNGYALSGYKWPNGVSSLIYKDYFTHSELNIAFLQLKNVWDATSTPIGITYSMWGYDILGLDYDIDDGYTGHCAWTLNGNDIIHAEIKLSWARYNPNSINNTAGHEWGHAFGLGDMYYGNVIMYKTSSGPSVPQAPDIAGINAMYQ